MAPRLTGPMIEALLRLDRGKVYADGRSVRALIRRGYVKRHGKCYDELIGNFHLDTITPAGQKMAQFLKDAGHEANT